MVGKFLFGMLSGGALVTGGMVLGSVLFPLQPMDAANAPAVERNPVTASGAADPAKSDPEVAIQAPEPVSDPDPSAPDPDPAAVVGAVATPEPTTTPEAVSPAESGSAPESGPEVAAALPPEEPAESPSATTTDSSGAEAAAAEVTPSADQPAAGEPVPAPEAAGAEDSAEAVEPSVPTVVVETTPPVVAEVPQPQVPPAPLPLPQLDTGAVLAALDDSARAAASAQPATEDAGPPPLSEPALATEGLPEIEEDGASPALAIGEGAPLSEPVAPVTPDPEPESLPDTLPDTLPDALPNMADEDALEPDTGAEPPPEPQVAAMPEIEGGPTFKPAPGLGARTEGVITRRLPRIGDVAPAAENETGQDGPDTAEAAPADTRPIVQFAASFDNPDGKPVLAIVLIDPGTPDLDRAGLAALPFPVGFALDPLDPATPDRAAIYRAAGKEVVMLATGIADGARASDVEVSFQSMALGLPEAVAVMDLTDSRFQGDRALASLVVPVIGAQGRGLLTWDTGLNAGDQVARRDDIASAVVFRDLTSAGDEPESIRRLLDRAVFKAGQDGRVTVAGTASPALVAALLEWSVEGRAASVVIAPLTAAMTVE